MKINICVLLYSFQIAKLTGKVKVLKHKLEKTILELYVGHRLTGRFIDKCFKSLKLFVWNSPVAPHIDIMPKLALFINLLRKSPNFPNSYIKILYMYIRKFFYIIKKHKTCSSWKPFNLKLFLFFQTLKANVDGLFPAQHKETAQNRIIHIIVK